MSQKVDVYVTCPYCGGQQLQPVMVAGTQDGMGPAQVLYCSGDLPVKGGGAKAGCGRNFVARVTTRYEIEVATINMDQG